MAMLAQDGEAGTEVPGVYGPKTSKPVFWILVVILCAWTIAILVISVKYFCQMRKKNASGRETS